MSIDVKYHKGLWICRAIVLCFFSLAFYGTFTRLYPTESYLSEYYLKSWSFLIFLPLFILYYNHFKWKVITWPKRRLKRFQNILGLLLCLPLFWFLQYAAFAYGLPAIIGRVSMQPFELNDKVISKKRSYGSRYSRCFYSIKLESMQYLFDSELCVPSGLWNKIEVGNQLRVGGMRSNIAYKVEYFYL